MQASHHVHCLSDHHLDSLEVEDVARMECAVQRSGDRRAGGSDPIEYGDTGASRCEAFRRRPRHPRCPTDDHCLQPIQLHRALSSQSTTARNLAHSFLAQESRSLWPELLETPFVLPGAALEVSKE